MLQDSSQDRGRRDCACSERRPGYPRSERCGRAGSAP